MEIFSSFFNFYNILGLLLIIGIMAFTLKLKYANGQNNSNSTHNYNALLAIEAIFGLIIIYKLMFLTGVQKTNAGLFEMLGL